MAGGERDNLEDCPGFEVSFVEKLTPPRSVPGYPKLPAQIWLYKFTFIYVDRAGPSVQRPVQ